MSLKLLSLNIERDKHFERVIPFLKKENPDVFCVQEVYETDLPKLQKLFPHVAFRPMTLFTENGQERTEGLAILSQFPFEHQASFVYAGTGGDVPRYVTHDMTTIDRLLLTVAIKKDGREYHICTTHFTWTPNGEADDTQRHDLEKLLNILKTLPEFVLCGDFNAPRGKEIFDTIAESYQDNIPPEITTTLDLHLHRSAPLYYVVDALFSTPQYEVDEVRVQDGVSDHCAIVAEIN